MNQPIDGWVTSTLAGGLEPGESVMGVAHVRRATGLDYTPFDDWIAAATDRRLILLGTEVQGVGTFTVLPQNRGAVVWWYQDLERAGLRDLGLTLAEKAITSVSGPMRVLTLQAWEGIRPTPQESETYLIPRNSLGLTGQVNFFEQYAAWLKPRVDARAFPLTPDRQRFHAERQARLAAAGVSAQKSRGQTLRAAPLLLAPLVLFGLFQCYDLVHGRLDTLAESEPADPTARRYWERGQELARDDVTRGAVWGAVAVIAAGTSALLYRRGRRAG